MSEFIAARPGVPADVFVPVNCAERMHVCQAICCRLHFALSAVEVEAGTGIMTRPW
jgi:hypothetical protein